jgi:hypothetical protein
MARSPLLLVGLLGLLLAGGLAVAAFAWSLDRDPLYAVAQVQAQFAHHPATWVGRAIMVQGVVVAGNPVDYPSPSLVDRDARAVDPLPLTRRGPDPLRALLRGLPLLGSLAPRAQVIRWDTVAVYRVQLLVQGRAHCGAGICDEAVRLDAAP